MNRISPKIDRKLVARVLGSGASVLLLVYLLSQQGWDAILAAIRGIPPATMAVVFLLLGISRLAVSARWYSLLRPTDPTIPFREAVRLTLAGLFAANFLPTTVGGDVVRAAGVVRLSRNPVGSTASIVADRLVGMFGMFTILPVGLIDLGAWLQHGPSAIRGAPLVLSLAGVRLPEPWKARLARVRSMIGRFVASFELWFRRPSTLVVALGFTWVHMICLFAEIWVLLRGMGSPTALVAIGGLWSLSYFVTLMPISINGLGLRELSVTYIFSEVGGVPLETALTLALILRTLDMLVSLPGAILIPTLPTRKSGP